jgi:hypothetical protein
MHMKGIGRVDERKGTLESRLTVAQAAAVLGVHPSIVRSRIEAGIIEAERVSTNYGEVYLVEPRSLGVLPTPSGLSMMSHDLQSDEYAASPAGQESRVLSLLERLCEPLREALNASTGRLEAVSRELGAEQVRRRELEDRVERLGEQLMVSEQQLEATQEQLLLLVQQRRVIQGPDEERSLQNLQLRARWAEERAAQLEHEFALSRRRFWARPFSRHRSP